MWVAAQRAALPTEVLEAGIYDGAVKSSLMVAYMAATQTRMRRKGWTAAQLRAIHSAFMRERERETMQHRKSFVTDVSEVNAVAQAAVRRAMSHQSILLSGAQLVEVQSSSSDSDTVMSPYSPDAVAPEVGGDRNPTSVAHLALYDSKARQVHVAGRRHTRHAADRYRAAVDELPSPPKGSPDSVTRRRDVNPPSHALEHREVFRRTMAATKGEAMNFMAGLCSYDLHANVRYRRMFALDALVPDRFLRGLPGHEVGAPDLAADGE